MKKSIIIAAIITVVAIIGVLIYFFMPKDVSYTFEGMISRGVLDEYHPATLEICGTQRGKTFEGTVVYTAEGKTQKVDATAEIRDGIWGITNKDADKNGIVFDLVLMPDFRKGKCVAIVTIAEEYDMAIFAAPATDEDQYYDVLDYINKKFE